MRIFQLTDAMEFPHPGQAHSEGLLAFGGDLQPKRIIKAYANGIFPWYEEGEPILWWSPDPRLVMKPTDFKCSKSLLKTVQRGHFSVSFDTNFEAVIESCANTVRKDSEGTWITTKLTKAFIELHHLGLAHSVEVWENKALVGGLYGLALGTVFFGESMFHTKTDASKVALFYLTGFLAEHKFELIDAQQDTAHLRSLGAYTINRNEFLNLLSDHVQKASLIGNWGNGKMKEQIVEI